MTSLFMPSTGRGPSTGRTPSTNPAPPDSSPRARIPTESAPAPLLPAAPTAPPTIAAPVMVPAQLASPGPEGAWVHQGWMTAGACHGLTSLFFAPHAERPQARVRREALARSICQACPVIDPCRDHARVSGEYGFWGGESEEERAIAGYAVPWPAGAGRRRSLAVAG